jgi:RimJ/RimL family protein N-acetyltransferase
MVRDDARSRRRGSRDNRRVSTDGHPRIRLEIFERSHLPAFEALIDDPDVRRFTRVPDPPPPDFSVLWFERYEAGRNDGTSEAFAILDDGTEEFLGVAVAPRIDRDTATAELGYVIAPTARGRGVATDALHLLTSWAFADLRALRLELLIDTENTASKKVAMRGGYRYEGTMRSVSLKPGVRADAEIWSRLPTDP